MLITSEGYGTYVSSDTFCLFVDVKIVIIPDFQIRMQL